MCGIHGFCWKDDTGAMPAMVKKARHRGPDGEGIWGDDFITLGHNLLSIVDTPPQSSQPWHTESSVMVYNGEIYNYKSLRAKIGGDFVSDTDTEVLIKGYEKFGKDFLYECDGMFAVAIYNKKSKKLLLARDSNGAKPLFYGYLKNKLAFSSEVASLLELGFERKVSIDGFKHFYYSGLTAGPITCFKNISRLVPGEIIELDIRTGVKYSSNINNRPIDPFTSNEEDIPLLLHDKLKQAVSMTLMGRRQVGLFLSGGMDSSSVLYEMSKSLGISAHTFSTKFDIPHKKCNHNEDAVLAKQLAELYGSDHKEIKINEQAWLDNLESAVLALEEPRQGKSYSAYYATNKFLRDNGVIVTLSGDGGDELLAGYKHYFNHATFNDRLDSLRLHHRKLLDPAKALTNKDQHEYLMSWIPKGGLTGNNLNDIMYIESLHTLSEDFLVRNDKLGMAFGMEARFPMMCNVFKNFARSIPGNLKAAPKHSKLRWDQCNKNLLRLAYNSKLPEFITTKNKTGWRAPTDDWVIGTQAYPAKKNSPIRAYFRDILSDREIMEIFEINSADIDNKYLNNVNHIGPKKASGKPSAGPGLNAQKELFTIVMFAVWYKKFRMKM
jgi:asparagine synthase (glutamine-hydrolysing)